VKTTIALVLSILASAALPSTSGCAQAEKRYECQQTCRASYPGGRLGALALGAIDTGGLECNPNQPLRAYSACVEKSKARTEKGKEDAKIGLELHEKWRACFSACNSRYPNRLWEVWKSECDTSAAEGC
jgi:hypothetical protein